jgi:hypothetical protein
VGVVTGGHGFSRAEKASLFIPALASEARFVDRRTDSSGLTQNADALAQILEQMHAAAATCAQMSTQPDAYSGIGPIAANLTTAWMR